MKSFEILEEENRPMQEKSVSERNTFPKSARLHHRTLVNALFDKGQSLYVYPLRCVWRVLSSEELQSSFRDTVPQGIGPVQLMITVPKKKRRHAVDRVRMRRLIREAFRQQRHALTALVESHPDRRTLSIAAIYIAEKNETFATVNRKMGILIKKLTAFLDNEKSDTSPGSKE